MFILFPVYASIVKYSIRYDYLTAMKRNTLNGMFPMTLFS